MFITPIYRYDLMNSINARGTYLWWVSPVSISQLSWLLNILPSIFVYFTIYWLNFFKVDSNLKFLCSEIRIEEKFISIYNIFDSTSEHFQILLSHERFWSKTSFNIQCHISWINVVITFLYFFSFWKLPVCLYLWAYLLFYIYIEILIHISTSFELEQLFPMSWVILFS